MPGDILILTAFISYVGCFTKKYRTDLMDQHWIPFLGKLPVTIPRTPDLDVISLLTGDAQIAQWNNEGKFFFYFQFENEIFEDFV